ncbi:hypothetical protein AB4Y72_14950 [Arthrobacter sp. YAF34]|uniref:hypothetical protein n=1 Tax=Arthrobacter sp. YAF34 TaxID=3233083 RepID=UPI003F9255FE
MREGSEKPIGLIDMDGNWLQWGVRLNEILLRLDPSCTIVDDDKRTGWDDLAGPGADRAVLKATMNHPDPYTGLAPVPRSALEMADEDWGPSTAPPGPGRTRGACP